MHPPSPMNGRRPHYFEDLSIGQRFRSGTYAVDAARIKAFAQEYDPQPFHLDERAAEHTLFHGLAASGWHTTAITMRLAVTGELRLANGILGVGVEELRWLKPVRPGDVLLVEGEVIAMRPSMSRPDHGVVKVRLTTVNQGGEAVQVVTSILLVERRAQAAF
ncbi:MAG TPA: MaoC family dehydratase [bacterium]|nr:MaoC family dehydratase [bacterium]